MEMFQLYLFISSPYRITDDVGGAFAMGTIGGSLFHTVIGYKNAAKVCILMTIYNYLTGFNNTRYNA